MMRGSKFISNRKEDSLTGTVIPSLLHLPLELFWQLLTSACRVNGLPADCGNEVEVEYWPRWSLKKEDSEGLWVEPDVFLRFNNFDLIIEAKRWDYEMQYKSQWKRELKGYRNEYVSDYSDRAIYVLALGGNCNTTSDTISVNILQNELKSKVLKCRWADLLCRCQKLQHELDGLSWTGNAQKALLRILNDVIYWFDFHGFATGRWFDDFKFDGYYFYQAEESQRALRELHCRYTGRWFDDFNLTGYRMNEVGESEKLFRSLRGGFG